MRNHCPIWKLTTYGTNVAAGSIPITFLSQHILESPLMDGGQAYYTRVPLRAAEEEEPPADE